MSPEPLVSILLWIFLPFLLIGFIGNMAGMKSHQSFMPLRMVAMAILNLFLFIMDWLFQVVLYFLASRAGNLKRKKVRIKLD